MHDKITLQTIEDFKNVSTTVLNKTTNDYFNGGSGREVTLQSNITSFDSYFIKPRIFSLTDTPDCATIILGKNITLPICVAPTAFHKLAHTQGELATCAAARKAGTIYAISCLSTTSLTGLRAEQELDHVWVQMLIFKNRQIMFSMIKQAEELGCGALVITVDAPVSGNRKKDTQNQFKLPENMRMEILHEHNLLSDTIVYDGSMLDTFFEKHIDPYFGWDDIQAIVQSTRLPVILKGILRIEDAQRAIESGIKGIIISNHGGRQLDGALPSIIALEHIARELQGALEIYVDGGFRNGTDVFKALSLGARAVFLGRPILWGLSVGGQTGVQTVLDIFKKELIHTMYLSGVSKINEINSHFIWRKSNNYEKQQSAL